MGNALLAAETRKARIAEHKLAAEERAAELGHTLTDWLLVAGGKQHGVCSCGAGAMVSSTGFTGGALVKTHAQIEEARAAIQLWAEESHP